MSIKKNNYIKTKHKLVSDNEAMSFNELVYNDEGKPVDYRIIDVNSTYEKVMGVKKSEVVGCLGTVRYQTNKVPHFDIIINVALTGEPAYIEGYFLPLEKYFRITICSHEKGKFNLIFNEIDRPINTIKGISDNALNAIIITDSKSNVIYWNKAAEKLLGYTEKEVLGRDLKNFVIPEVYHDAYNETFDQFISFEDDSLFKKTVIRKLTKKDNTKIIAEINFSISCTEDERYIVGVVRDITDRKIFERDIEEKLRNFEFLIDLHSNELKESSKKLDFARERLQELNNSKKILLSSILYELNAPIYNIINANTRLEKQSQGELNEKQLEEVKLINTNTQELLSILNNIMDLSSIYASTIDICIEEFSIEKFVNKVFLLLQKEFEEKNISFNYIIQPDIKTMQGDRVLCKQILFNLISNALKFTPEKGLISIEATQNKENSITISVKDNGVEFTKQELSSDFPVSLVPDQVLEQAIRTKDVGLLLSKTLVEIQGGNIGFDTEKNKQNTIWFTIPLNKEIKLLYLLPEKS